MGLHVDLIGHIRTLTNGGRQDQASADISQFFSRRDPFTLLDDHLQIHSYIPYPREAWHILCLVLLLANSLSHFLLIDDRDQKTSRGSICPLRPAPQPRGSPCIPREHVDIVAR